eukprot:4070389-Lingulodinium_polyedra.AAC.1
MPSVGEGLTSARRTQAPGASIPQASSTAGHHVGRCSDPASPRPQRGQAPWVLGSQASALCPCR